MGINWYKSWAIVFFVFISVGCASNNLPADQNKKIGINLVSLESRAEQAYQAGQLEMAEGLYREVLSHKRDYAPAWFRLGNIYTRTNRLDAAVNAYNNCISSDKEFAKAWHNLSIARIRQATDILIEAQNHLIVDSPAKNKMDQLFLQLMRLQSSDQKQANVVKND